MKKKHSKKIKNWILINIIIFIIVIDVYSKHWITNNIKLYEAQKICSILNFFHIHNYGAAFSFLSNQGGWQRWFLSIISSFIILILIKGIMKSDKTKIKKNIFYCLIIAGAIGNLIDRIFYGFVIDFIDFHINNWHFATFNIADSSIFVGIFMTIKKFF